ncbi:MAG TPA: hypothetical protein VKU85_13475 [bacterium]|nr:hypothetical protein [bacterium]
MRAALRNAAPVLALVLLVAAAHAITEGPDPIPFGFDLSAASTHDNQVTFDLVNSGSEIVVIEVLGYYNDGVKGHDAAKSVSVRAGETKTVSLAFNTVTGPMPVETITDDINPISMAPAQTVALGASLGE